MPDEQNQTEQTERCPRVTESELSCLDIWRLTNIAAKEPVTRVPNDLLKNLAGDHRELQWKIADLTRQLASVVAERDRIEQLVSWLADPYVWNWTSMLTNRDAADRVLQRAAELGIVERESHPLGGRVWIINGNRYGRTD